MTRYPDDASGIESALVAAGLPVVPCGLNADWSTRSWCLTAGADPNRTEDRAIEPYCDAMRLDSAIALALTL